MRLLINIGRFILIVLLIIGTHFFIVNILPSPFNHLNILLAALLWLMYYSPRAPLVWLGIAVAFVFDLYGTMPFASYMISTTITLGLLRWLSVTVFTHLTPITVFLTSIIAILVFRLVILALGVSIGLLFNYYFYFDVDMLAGIGYEIALTSIFLFIIYIFSYRRLKRLNFAYLAPESRLHL